MKSDDAKRIACACGCGQMAPALTASGRARRFIHGHNARVREPRPSLGRTGLCECGCGLPTTIATSTDATRGDVKGQPHRYHVGHGSRMVAVKGYRSAPGQGYTPKRLHILRAERALGRPLPPGAEVHHADGSMNDNAPLVICQDLAYHRLLHARSKVLRAGGNPNADKVCGHCHAVKPLSAFNLMRGNKSDGRQSTCRECGRARDAARRGR